MPQNPYPGAVEIARFREAFASKRQSDLVVRRQRRRGFPRSWVDPNVIYVVGTSNTWGAYIRRMLATRGMTITELARRSGLDRSTISQWINHGVRNIRTDSIYLIADALGGDRAQALLAAGNVQARDPDIELILSTNWSDADKLAMIERLVKGRAAQPPAPPDPPKSADVG